MFDMVQLIPSVGSVYKYLYANHDGTFIHDHKRDC